MITGAGAISAAGPRLADLRAALHGESTCIGPLSLFDTTGLRVHIAGEARLPSGSPLLSRQARVRASRSDRFALAALEEALALSGLDLERIDRERIGVAIGSSTGGMFETETYYQRRLRGERAGRYASCLAAAAVSSPADLVASAVRAAGPRLAPSTACSSGANAIAFALFWIRAGLADVVIAGGTDSLTRTTFTGFHSLQALSGEPCRPFDGKRQGLSLGEGAGIMVLESEAHAVARGAPPLAELAGAGLSCDASHTTAPHPEGRGAVQALRRALADAQVRPEDVDYVNAHGTGTPQNDMIETRALKSVLGEHARRVPVSSTKSIVGHLLGAAGAIEAVATLLAIEEQFVPPTLNWAEPDAECDLDYVPTRGHFAPVRVAVSNSYGFGGNNTTLVLRAWTPGGAAGRAADSPTRGTHDDRPERWR